LPDPPITFNGCSLRVKPEPAVSGAEAGVPLLIFRTTPPPPAWSTDDGMPSQAARHAEELRHLRTRRVGQRWQLAVVDAFQFRNLGALIRKGPLKFFHPGFQRAHVLPTQVIGANPFRFFCFSEKFVGTPLGHLIFPP
jgi:hypothetical protein